MDAHPNPSNRADPDLILSTPLPEPSAAASAVRSLTTDTASPFEPLCSASGPRNRSPYSKKKTVLLCDWWLLSAPEAHEGRRLSVGGMVAERYKGPCRHKGDRSGSKFLLSPWQKAERVFESAPITKRYDTFILGTADGITVRIQGVINKVCSHQNGVSLEDRAYKKGRSLHSSGTTIWRPSYNNRYPLTRETARKLSIASPESLNLKRSRSGRLLVPPIAKWCQKIIYAANGEITAITGEGLENLSCVESQSEPPRKRKKLV